MKSIYVFKGFCLFLNNERKNGSKYSQVDRFYFPPILKIGPIKEDFGMG